MKKKFLIGVILLVGAVASGVYLSPLNSWLPRGNRTSDFTVGTSVGNQAPDFNAVSIDGQNLHLSELRGKTVLINVFASWCGPCQAETPFLVELAKDNPNAFVVIGLNLGETPEAVKVYRQDFNVSYPLLPDLDGRLAETYKAIGLPTSWFIDPGGIVRYVHAGPMTLDMMQQILDDIQSGQRPGT